MDCLSESILNEFENYYTNRHYASKPPKEAYFYFPKENEIIDTDYTQPSKSKRKLFEGGVEFTVFESEELLLFKKEIKLYSPEIFPCIDESTCLRFLQSSSYNHLKALKSINQYYEWKSLYFPLFINFQHKAILNSGFIYVHGRDHRFRPIIIVDPQVFLKNINRFSVEDIIYSLIYFLEYVLQNLFIPGQIENWIIICDISNISVTTLPRELKIIMKTLNKNYKCRLYTMYILNLSIMYNLLWKGFKSFLNANIEKKIIITQEKDNYCELFRSINKSQVEKKYGGNAENIYTHYFPPIFPSNNYFLPEENPEDILVSEQKYSEIVRNNSKIKVSPFLSSNRESYFTFHPNDMSFKRSEISIYEEAKSNEQQTPLEESKYEECVESYFTRNKEEVIKIEKNEEISSDFYRETIKVSYDSNENNVIKEKNSEMDSAITNITQNSNNYIIIDQKHIKESKKNHSSLYFNSRNKDRFESENIPSKESKESSSNSKSEIIGKQHPNYFENDNAFRANATNFETDTKNVCCGNKIERCCII